MASSVDMAAAMETNKLSTDDQLKAALFLSGVIVKMRSEERKSCSPVDVVAEREVYDDTHNWYGRTERLADYRGSLIALRKAWQSMKTKIEEEGFIPALKKYAYKSEGDDDHTKVNNHLRWWLAALKRHGTDTASAMDELRGYIRAYRARFEK